MTDEDLRDTAEGRRFPLHGWIGLGLVAVFWVVNWSPAASDSRTVWGFFPLWLGYCLTVDALVYWRKETSMLARSPAGYLALFLISAPAWWLFEAFDQVTARAGCGGGTWPRASCPSSMRSCSVGASA